MMRPVLGGVVGCDGDDCAEGSLDKVEVAGENEQLEKPCNQPTDSARQHQQQPPAGATTMPGPHAEAGDDEGTGDTREQKVVELMSLGGRINATHRKISKTAGTAPRMISDAIRDDLLDAVNEFVSKVC